MHGLPNYFLARNEMSIWRGSPFLVSILHPACQNWVWADAGEVLEYIVLWDDPVVPSARTQSKCQLMDSVDGKLEICAKRRNEFTSRRIGIK